MPRSVGSALCPGFPWAGRPGSRVGGSSMAERPTVARMMPVRSRSATPTTPHTDIPDYQIILPMAQGLMYDNPSPGRQAPLSGSAGSLASFDPPRSIGLPRLPAQPVPFVPAQPPMGPPMGGPPMASVPFIPPGPGMGPVGMGPAGPGAGMPALPPGVSMEQLLPFLQAMFG